MRPIYLDLMSHKLGRWIGYVLMPFVTENDRFHLGYELSKVYIDDASIFFIKNMEKHRLNMIGRVKSQGNNADVSSTGAESKRIYKQLKSTRR